MTARSRLFLYDTTAAGQAETIALTSDPLPYNCYLRMWTFQADAPPAAAGLLSLSKDSVEGPEHDVVFREFDPSDAGIADFACHHPWQFKKGDRVVVTYPNPDDETTGVEVVLEEA